MIAGLMIGLREVLEAALIASAVAAALRKSGMRDLFKPLWLGIGLAVIVSAGAAALISWAGIAFTGRTEEIFEGVLMLTAAGVISWVVLWMRKQGRDLGKRLTSETTSRAAAGNSFGIFSLVFMAVVREGIELALLLMATTVSTDGAGALIGAVIGMAVAVAVGVLLYAGAVRLRLEIFFRVTSILLVMVAAGLLAHGVHELQEAAVLPMVIEHIWDLNPILDEASVFGQLLKAMFGYNGNPSLLELLAFVSYLGAAALVAISYRRGRRRREPCRPTPSAPSPASAK